MNNLIEVAGGGAAFVAILGVAILGVAILSGIRVSLACLAITARATS